MAKSTKATVQSVEPIVTHWANQQLNAMNLNPVYEQGQYHNKIKDALRSSLSKTGGEGGCRVDAQIMLSNGAKSIPVMIEYKGTKGSLEKLDKHNLVLLMNDKGEYLFNRELNKYAVNGASYYSACILKKTEFREVLSIGINGYKDDTDTMQYEVKAYISHEDNPDLPIFIGEYQDLAFLDKANLRHLFEQIENAQLDPLELQRKHTQDENRLDKVLKDLNQHLHEVANITVPQRIAIVTPCIMAGLGVIDKDTGNYIVAPLKPEELTGSNEDGETDGDKIFKKVSNFLKKRDIPDKKRLGVENSLRQTLLHSNLQKKVQGESPLKSAYEKIYKDVIPAYKTTSIHDFTGKLFNVMNDWVSVPDGGANDIVLTPRYVTALMARLAKVDKNSYVWDWALGSGGFLISAMNIMLKDAKNSNPNEQDYLAKEKHIKEKQLLGVEKIADIYILAVLNMILMGDGSTGIINENSLTEFNGKYLDKDEVFPANVFLLNPPYSAQGNGMVFVEQAFNKMMGTDKNDPKKGRGVVIIQDSAGTGKATEYNQRILKHSTLVASIKMPMDLFKASVQTSIYVFDVGTPHDINHQVKFIDFSNDGYKRTNRKKASTNLTDVDNRKGRYDEVVEIVCNGKIDNTYYKLGESLFLDKINPLSGKDWNFNQHKKVDTKPTVADFKRTVSDYLAWEVAQILQGKQETQEVKM